MRAFQLAFLVVALTATQTHAQRGYVPPRGFVPDAKTAVAIARAVLIPVYGEDTIRGEEPLIANRHGEEWYVDGTLQCAPHCLGGTVFVAISARTGAIITMFHTK